MKTRDLTIVIFFCLSICPILTQAQFLKKLGHTVKQVAQEAVAPEQTSATASPGSASTSPSTSASAAAPAVIDARAHQITVSPAGLASFRAGEYFIEAYSSIVPSDSGFRAVVAVGQMTTRERLSESGDGSDKDVVYVYDRGKKVRTTTVAQLDSRQQAIAKQYDWYATPSVVNTGEEGKYLKRGAMSTTIVFQGKKYGPYPAVFQMIVSRDKTRFFATVSPTMDDIAQQKNYLLSNDGKLKPIPFGGELLANITFTTGCMILSPVTTLASRVATEEDEAKQAALQQQMAEVMTQHPNENEVIFFDGRTLSGVMTEYKWLDQSGNNLFSTKTDPGNGFKAGLYLNGKWIAADQPHEGHAWCNAQGTNWAYGSLGEVEPLVFKDGTRIKEAIHPRQITLQGKSYLVWFMYDRVRSDQITLCSKAL